MTFTQPEFFPKPAPKPVPADGILALPAKATCTIGEAARALGVSERQVRYWIEDGTLLAVNSSRDPLRHERGDGTLNRWRPVVRRPAGEPAPADGKLLTLAELVERASNAAG